MREVCVTLNNEYSRERNKGKEMNNNSIRPKYSRFKIFNNEVLRANCRYLKAYCEHM